MLIKKLISLLVVALGLSACSDEYIPPEGATGEMIYLEACAKCHAEESDAKGMYWTINVENVNDTYVAHKVHTGSLTMPRFPNIKGRDMRVLREFVLQHSLRK